MEQTFLKLTKWLEKPGNNPAMLAGLLGYQTSETIRRWVENRSVPKKVRSRVLQIIKGN